MNVNASSGPLGRKSIRANKGIPPPHSGKRPRLQVKPFTKAKEEEAEEDTKEEAEVVLQDEDKTGWRR